MVAMALLPEPKLVIADEHSVGRPSGKILKLLRRLATERGVSVLFATHDLDTAWEICDRVAVMCAGRARNAPIAGFFRAPMVPYTRLLLESLPTRRILGVARHSRRCAGLVIAATRLPASIRAVAGRCLWDHPMAREPDTEPGALSSSRSCSR